MVRRVSFILMLGTSLAFSNLGVWIVRDMITSPASLMEIMERVERIGANRIYVQVVGRADAFYDSDILPRSEMLKDAPEDFDPLATILKLAREKGIKVSAWINVFYAWPFGKKPESEKHVINSHPEWVTYDDRGYSMLEYSKAPAIDVPGVFLDPGLDEVKDFVASVAEEIARKYDVDEIHLDYIRYPFRTFGYNPIVMRRYRKWIRKAMREGKIENMADAFDDFRREQINETVKRIHEVVHRHGKNLSAAVLAYYDDAYNNRFQDWISWLKENYLDFAVIMAYDPSVETVESYIEHAEKELGSLKSVRIGIGLYKMHDDPELLKRIIETALSHRPDEIVLFSYKFINERVEPVLKGFFKNN